MEDGLFYTTMAGYFAALLLFGCMLAVGASGFMDISKIDRIYFFGLGMGMLVSGCLIGTLVEISKAVHKNQS